MSSNAQDGNVLVIPTGTMSLLENFPHHFSLKKIEIHITCDHSREAFLGNFESIPGSALQRLAAAKHTTNLVLPS